MSDNTTKNTTSQAANAWLDEIKFDDQGLIPAIAQEHASGQVLMVAWMNQAALQATVASGQAVYYSRSRQRLWHKGEQSGHVQQVHSIRLDCDGDVILLQVTQVGKLACHTGRVSCFFRELQHPDGQAAWTVVNPVIKDPKDIYGK